MRGIHCVCVYEIVEVYIIIVVVAVIIIGALKSVTQLG